MIGIIIGFLKGVPKPVWVGLVAALLLLGGYFYIKDKIEDYGDSQFNLGVEARTAEYDKIADTLREQSQNKIREVERKYDVVYKEIQDSPDDVACGRLVDIVIKRMPEQ